MVVGIALAVVIVFVAGLVLARVHHHDVLELLHRDLNEKHQQRQPIMRLLT